MKREDLNKLSNKERAEKSKEILKQTFDYYKTHDISMTKVCKMFNVSRTSLTKYMKDLGETSKFEKKHTLNEKYFSNIDTESKAYWLGFIYADGCITENKIEDRLKALTLEITLKDEDRGHLAKFLESIESNTSVKDKIIKLNGKEIITCRISINCTSLCRDLIRQGCTPRKSLTITFPNSLPSHLVRHFIRGYIDGDGCISTRKRLSVVGTESFLNSMQGYFIKSLNIKPTNVRPDKRGKHFIYEKGGKETLLILEHLYSDSNIYLDRKYNKALAYLQSDL